MNLSTSGAKQLGAKPLLTTYTRNVLSFLARSEISHDSVVLALGSYAREDVRPGSDIDLLILTKDKAQRKVYRRFSFEGICYDYNDMSIATCLLLQRKSPDWQHMLYYGKVLRDPTGVGQEIIRGLRSNFYSARSVRHRVRQFWEIVHAFAKASNEFSKQGHQWMGLLAMQESMVCSANIAIDISRGIIHSYYRHLHELERALKSQGLTQLLNGYKVGLRLHKTTNGEAQVRLLHELASSLVSLLESHMNPSQQRLELAWNSLGYDRIEAVIQEHHWLVANGEFSAATLVLRRYSLRMLADCALLLLSRGYSDRRTSSIENVVEAIARGLLPKEILTTFYQVNLMPDVDYDNVLTSCNDFKGGVLESLRNLKLLPT